jgi:hypothetical protein
MASVDGTTSLVSGQTGFVGATIEVGDAGRRFAESLNDLLDAARRLAESLKDSVERGRRWVSSPMGFVDHPIGFSAVR